MKRRVNNKPKLNVDGKIILKSLKYSHKSSMSAELSKAAVENTCNLSAGAQTKPKRIRVETVGYYVLHCCNFPGVRAPPGVREDILRGMRKYLTKYKKFHGLSPPANYTDRANAACWRSDCQLLRI
jgi:hypothetical protein